MTNINYKNIIIATHVYTTGPSQELRDFLVKGKIEKLLFIGHPLFFDKNLKGSSYEIFCNGEKKSEKISQIRRNLFITSNFKDLFLTVVWSIKYLRNADLFVGFDNLNALAGAILRKIGFVKKCVYYVVDYNPKRFKNGLINAIYHKIDHFCVKYCDETWNLSDRMREGRIRYFNFNGGNQKTVPMGAWVERIRKTSLNEIDEYTLVFMGHLTKKQGVQKVINSIPGIIKEIPDFKFLILGGGPFSAELKKMVYEKNISRNVEFTGYIDDAEDVENRLSRCAVAIAPYEKYDENGNLTFTYFADPGKIKLYLACGLPVLLTDVSYNASEIQSKKCGLIISNEEKNIANAVIMLMKNPGKLKEYKENAYRYARSFDWNIIFGKIINNEKI